MLQPTQLSSPITLGDLKKRQRDEADDENEYEELPHNLGRALKRSKQTSGSPDNNGFPTPKTDPGASEIKPSFKTSEFKSGIPYPENEATEPDPWLAYNFPTHEQCEEVFALLSQTHGRIERPERPPPPSHTYAGCGEVKDILDGLLRTRLSANTSGGNAGKAIAGLVAKYGVAETGAAKGSVNWEAARQLSQEELELAIKCGGMQKQKSKDIKKILDMVYEDNLEKRKFIEENSNKKDDSLTLPGGISSADFSMEDLLDINYLHALDTLAVEAKLKSFPGIGLKTAQCVTNLNMGRPRIAADTHIFRIVKWLGWPKPPPAVNELTAMDHLNVRIPDPLKYGLHQLLIRHGKACARCGGRLGMDNERWEEECVIEHLVQRVGHRLVGVDGVKVVRKGASRGKAKAKAHVKNEDASDEEYMSE
ncbi:DNA glycosylase [Aulographum hederae CBS 113979]|uniref:DNA glycosylase n=1 Tax=Aulographum hederae CBS 113979 TaxID=1176131 RepID=A0A6G1HEG7_9PEZI|nr:DNA glycosylase [Aulographum hederae CBS 113979]